MFLSIRSAAAFAVIAAVAGVIGLGGGPTIGLVAAGDLALVMAIAADVLLAPPGESLRAQRSAPGSATTGKTERVTIRVRNPLGRTLLISLRDESPPSLARTPLVHTAVIPPRATAELVASITPSRRGRIPMGPIVARTAGPLRLAGRQTRLALAAELKVYPPLPGRARVSLLIERARTMEGGERATRLRGGAGEFDSLRDYHRDDEFRRINWHATARAAKPISNVFREERNQQVLLLLDAGRMMAGNVEGVPRLEWGIDAAVALAELATGIGDHVGMAAFGRDLRALVPPRGGRAHPARVLDALFALDASLDAPNYAHVFASLLARWRRRSLLVLITELTDVNAMEPLLRALPILLRRHMVMIGSVSDPDVTAIAHSMPRSSEDAYEKAAAAHALSERERAAARLRALGAIVVDRPPGALSGALADRYLNVKARGRL